MVVSAPNLHILSSCSWFRRINKHLKLQNIVHIDEKFAAVMGAKVNLGIWGF